MNFKDYSFAHHGEVYAQLDNAFKKYSISYYLVGANARDIQLYKAGIKPSRGTADIDFAIMVPDIEVYDALFDTLCKSGFRKADERYRLYYEKTNTAIDLMPYGEIEQEYTVRFIDRDLTLSVLGFKEVGENAELFEKEGFSLPVTPVEGIFILKLVAWSEKPDWRTKDLEDISFLLNHGWDIYEEEAYNEHHYLFEDDFDQTTAAARIIGRKIAPIIAPNDKLKTLIIGILEEATREKDRAQPPETSIAGSLDKTIEEVQEILRAMLRGIKEMLP